LIGLEFILNLFTIQHIELAEKLGIKKQNINMWVKGRQSIPKKYLPVLEELFGIDQFYFGHELTEIDKLELQKEKLKRDLKPVVNKYEQQFSIGEVNDLVEVPIYDKEEMNTIELEIKKAKLTWRFKAALDVVEKNPYIETKYYKRERSLNEKDNNVFHCFGTYTSIINRRIFLGKTIKNCK
jgi:transcriptional regulator with XRE-family HTH domain